MFETIRFIAVATALVVAGVVSGVILAGGVALITSPLEGVAASVAGVLTALALFGPLLVVPIVGIRRLRLRIPPDEPEPRTPRPVRRSDAAIRAEVQRLDARLAPGPRSAIVDDVASSAPGGPAPAAAPSSAVGETRPEQAQG